FVVFQQRRVETAVLEVGMGGRLDATNIVTPALSVITRIDFDHEAYLGRSIEAIAFEKAGILNPGVPAVLAPQRPEAEATLLARAAAVCSPVFHAADWAVSGCKIDPRGSSFMARNIRVKCPLAGEHQIENALTAVVALDLLGIDSESIEQ